MNARYIAAAAASLLLLSGCGRVDTQLEKKVSETSARTSYSLDLPAVPENEEAVTPADSSEAEKETTTKKSTKDKDADKKTDKDKETEPEVTTAVPVVTTTRMITTSIQPTTAPPATTPPPTETTTETTTISETETSSDTSETSGNAETSETEISETVTEPPAETAPETTTTVVTYADPNSVDVNCPGLYSAAAVFYNGAELKIGDPAYLLDDIGETLDAPTSIYSPITGQSVMVYHYSWMDVETDNDSIVSMAITYDAEFRDVTPLLATGITLGSSIDTLFGAYGSGVPISEDSLVYYDGNVKMTVDLPDKTVSRITLS